jgi:cyclic pyranopterin phosphate synthase
VPKENIINEIEKKFGELKLSYKKKGNGPAIYYDLKDFKGGIGFISAVTNEFCSNCNRIRLTADGKLKLCLHYNQGIDLRELLRSNLSDLELKDKIQCGIHNKPKHHNFKEKTVDDMDLKYMVQIGG